MASVKQRGSALGYALMILAYRLLGYRVSKLILYPVVFFYALVTPSERRALALFYRKAGHPFSRSRYYRHLFQFAIILLDRFVARIDPESFHFSRTGQEAYLELFEKGGIVLSTHFGGWAGVMQAMPNYGKQIHVVMHEAMKQNIRQFEASLPNPEERQKKLQIIDMSEGPLAVATRIAQVLKEKGVVAIMADRASEGKPLRGLLFGEPAAVNRSPFLLAQRRQANLVAVVLIREGDRRYHIIVEKLDTPAEKDPEKCQQALAENYLRFLEPILKKHPDQWFNFYNFWKDTE